MSFLPAGLVPVPAAAAAAAAVAAAAAAGFMTRGPDTGPLLRFGVLACSPSPEKVLGFLPRPWFRGSLPGPPCWEEGRGEGMEGGAGQSSQVPRGLTAASLSR